MPIFKNPAYFSVTSLALNDVKVRGGNVIKQSHMRNCYWSKDDRVLAESENFGYAIHDCQMFVSESTVYLSTFVKMLLCNLEEYIYTVYMSVYF